MQLYIKNSTKENENLNEAENPQLNIGAVSGSLPSDEEIRGGLTITMDVLKLIK